MMKKVPGDRVSSPSPAMERGLGGEVSFSKHHGITQSARVSTEKLGLARKMRKLPTNAEAQAWELLRDRRCLGFKFRRQQVIRGLIVDFYCPELRLVVEVDGEIHQQQAEYDAARDAVMAAENITVLRVPNTDVARIPELIKDATSPPPPLHDCKEVKLMSRVAGSSEKTRLTIEISANVRERLEALRNSTNSDSITAVIRKSLSVYDQLHKEMEDGYEVFYATRMVRNAA